MHTATKYLNGHRDVVAGAVCGSAERIGPLRMRQHTDLAGRLKRHEVVLAVFYPSPDLHPQPEIVFRQTIGGSGLIGFEVDGGEHSDRAFVDQSRHFGIGVSWGGFESLAPPLWPGGAMPESYRDEIGLRPCSVRLSSGLEDVDDLREDLQQALTHAVAAHA